jgi:2',3'-cyclic-nucleotide 2'-phosphodiesterase (5'-nucleotidase family)
VNALGIDVAVPGNWDFAYGPGVFRKRYTPTGPFPTILKASLPSFSIKSPTFPVIASNLFYSKLGPADTSPNGGLVLSPTFAKTINGVKIGFIGITSDIVPKMYEKLATGFSFTEGETAYKDLVNSYASQLRSQGCQIVAVMSELGIHKDFRLAQIINVGAVDVFFSAHTHEVTYTPLTSASGAIVVEAGNDGYLGVMDIKVENGKVIYKNWNLFPISDTIPEDSAMVTLVNAARAPFLIANPNLTDPFGMSAQTLNQPINATLGHSMGTITRMNALESSFNQAFTEIARQHANKQIGISPGFRFDSPIAQPGYEYEDKTIADGAITVEDVYRFFPVFYTLATAKVRGDGLKTVFENLLTSVYSQTLFNQEGGWVDGFAGVKASINLNNADNSKVISLQRSSDNTLIAATDTLTVIGCVRPDEATDVICSHTGFFEKADYLNPITGSGYTTIQLFSEYLASNNVQPVSTRFITDISGNAEWPRNVFVQPLPATFSCTPSVITGTEDWDQAKFVIYPNPATDKFVIKFSSVGTNQYEIISHTGQKVLSGKSDKTEVSIYLPDLTEGLYVVRATSEGNVSIKTQKLLIIH